MRLMLDLALNNTGAPISLKDVARRQEISDKYLEQIISVLNRAGYVRSVRGAQGDICCVKAPGGVYRWNDSPPDRGIAGTGCMSR